MIFKDLDRLEVLTFSIRGPVAVPIDLLSMRL
jgi:hypothetical protein